VSKDAFAVETKSNQRLNGKEQERERERDDDDEQMRQSMQGRLQSGLLTMIYEQIRERERESKR
jgi:hypothetical protein